MALEEENTLRAEPFGVAPAFVPTAEAGMLTDALPAGMALEDVTAKPPAGWGDVECFLARLAAARRLIVQHDFNG